MCSVWVLVWPVCELRAYACPLWSLGHLYAQSPPCSTPSSSETSLLIVIIPATTAAEILARTTFIRATGYSLCMGCGAILSPPQRRCCGGGTVGASDPLAEVATRLFLRALGRVAHPKGTIRCGTPTADVTEIDEEFYGHRRSAGGGRTREVIVPQPYQPPSHFKRTQKSANWATFSFARESQPKVVIRGHLPMQTPCCFCSSFRLASTCLKRRLSLA